MPSLRLILGLACIAACERTGSSSQGKPQVGHARPRYLSPEEECLFDSSTVHTSPIELVRDFLNRDAQGQFLQTDPWFATAVTCPGHEPGPDAFAVMRGYTIAFDTLPGDTVRARIVYEMVGSLVGGAHLDIDTTADVRILKVTNGPYGWRIESPAIDQFVRLDVVLQLKWLPDSLRLRLRALERGRG